MLDAASDRLLERAAKRAFQGVDPSTAIARLTGPRRTFVIVYSAQGVIDNGGFQYLFESDWPGTPPYSEFSAAYRTIGADNAAEWLDAATAMFPFDSPHLDRAARVRYLRAHAVAGDSPMGRLSGEAIDASDDVWRRLLEFAARHEEFGLGSPWARARRALRRWLRLG